MRRLIAVLAVPALAAVTVMETYRRGYLWPIATTFYRCFTQPEPCNEADWPA